MSAIINSVGLVKNRLGYFLWISEHFVCLLPFLTRDDCFVCVGMDNPLAHWNTPLVLITDEAALPRMIGHHTCVFDIANHIDDTRVRPLRFRILLAANTFVFLRRRDTSCIEVCGNFTCSLAGNHGVENLTDNLCRRLVDNHFVAVGKAGDELAFFLLGTHRRLDLGGKVFAVVIIN